MRKSSSVLAVFAVTALLALGAAVFFFGWAQSAVPPGSYGVMRTKTHGVDPRVIRDGEFRWVWYKLIPTNAVISVYSPSRVERPFSVSGDLPSADSYRRFASLEADFSYRLDGSFAFSVKPESLPALAESRGIAGQDDLKRLEAVLASEIASYIDRRLAEYREKPEALLDAAFPDRLNQEIAAAFPDIEALGVTLDTVKLPDFALYDSLRLLYQDYLDGQRRMLAEDLRAAASRNLAAQLRLDELSKYGELLTRYPILLQYLGIENGDSR
jgi:hypothetical protein